ncbi:DUF4783 domain-containing protein [Spirosoma taeanense]|uniref:DUF4783 domain-containing protein n=1 Tax=Spirosoma taeanense TaxID=2735870 RepID=A0A6M5YD29_9BACT|nr:DUF4783 domain-containing protein [Spirosoma taeanense]QJW91216.1 DUF4783 domain-containing protein [Spirosoma taeanense]
MNFLAILFLLPGLWLAPKKPVPNSSIIEVVKTSLRNGNAGQLSTRFARKIELIIDAQQVEFPSVEATHAELILRTFFRKYPPHRFQFVYMGSSDRLRYSTGTYQTNGRTFAVYVLMAQNAHHQYEISTLHFRNE